MRTVTIQGELDLRRTMSALSLGGSDPTTRFTDGIWRRASRTPEGAVAISLEVHENQVLAEAHGPGAAWALERAGTFCGADREVRPVAGATGRLRDLEKKHPGVRQPRFFDLMHLLAPTILQQKVTWEDGAHAWKKMVWEYGEEAPGPWGLRLPPSAETLARLPYYALSPFGVGRQQAHTLALVASRMSSLERLWRNDGLDALERGLLSLRGIGHWTTGALRGWALGDEDAVIVGDFHLPNTVVHFFTGKPRGDDDEMLALLEPFRGQRARVVKLIGLSGLKAPKFGPRSEVRARSGRTP